MRLLSDVVIVLTTALAPGAYAVQEETSTSVVARKDSDDDALSNKIATQRTALQFQKEATSLSYTNNVDDDPSSALKLWRNNDNNKDDAVSNACASQTNCTSCYAYSSVCHWCSGDHKCHAKGSVHGCLRGASCDSSPDDKNHTADNGCYVHTTCYECAQSSKLCHWCAHDNQCHAVGSVYGCMNGVDCYSNQECTRQQPEAIQSGEQMASFERLEIIWLIGLCVVGAVLVGAATGCLCLAGCVKGAYDELADLTLQQQQQLEQLQHGVEDDEDDVDTRDFHDTLEQPLLSSSQDEGDADDDAQAGHSAAAAAAQTEQEQGETNQPEEQGEASAPENPATDEDEQANTEEERGDAAPMVTSPDPPGESARDDDDYPLVTIITRRSSSRGGRRSNRPGRQRRGPRYMRHLYSVCILCYLIILTVIGLTIFAAFQYYPRIPQAMVCSDAFSWKSILDGLVAARAEADVQLLASIANPNYVQVALDLCKGTFTHRGAFVASFEIPTPLVISTVAITDTMILAHFKPERWEAASMASEFYHNTLWLEMEVEATVRIPILMDYSVTVHRRGIPIPVMSNATAGPADRHLCFCSGWDDDWNQTTPTPTSAAPSSSPQQQQQAALPQPLPAAVGL